MYGSFGQHSVRSIAAEVASPINIGNVRSSTACAFPSWPNSARLAAPVLAGASSSCSSYLSDEDLFDLDDSNARGVCHNNGRHMNYYSSDDSFSPPPGWNNAQQPFATSAEVNNDFEAHSNNDRYNAGHQLSDEELAIIQRERQAYQREMVRVVVAEKERRRVARRQRRIAAAANTSAPAVARKN